MTRKIASRIAALAATAALLSACGAASPIQTKENYAPSDGVRIEFSNGVRFENFFLLTADAGEPIRPMGSIVNSSNSAAEVTIDVDGNVQTHELPANTVLSLETDGTIIDGVDALPGTNIPVTVTSGGVTIYDVPVLDGTIPPYDELLP
ncbi:MAG: hypothetical protein L0G23_00825 [Ruaniaceae bacterium]|nr:hypothetical protein [Ruaniaceae bacterium]